VESIVTKLKIVEEGSLLLQRTFIRSDVLLLDFAFVLENNVASCKDPMKCVSFPEEVFLDGGIQKKKYE
jgi:hypothetical protein